MTTAKTVDLAGRYFIGSRPCQVEPDAFHEIHGQILGDLGYGFYLVNVWSWRTHGPCAGDEVIHLGSIAAGGWLLFATADEMIAEIARYKATDTTGQDDDKVVPIRH
jgi:hypothetical protein